MLVIRMNLFLLPFAIILFVYPLYTTAQTKKEGIFFYEEKIDYGSNVKLNGTIPQVYDDGTIVLRVIRTNVAKILTRRGPCTGGNTIRITKKGKNYSRTCIRRDPEIDPIGDPNPSNSTDPPIVTIKSYCSLEKFSLRIIHPNGTVDEKDIDLKGIDKKINYCSDGLKFYLIRKDQILVTYYNNTNNNTDDHYVERGMIIDFDGNVKDSIPFGINDLFSSITLNIDREQGFLRVAGVINETTIEWHQYQVNPDGKIISLAFWLLANLTLYQNQFQLLLQQLMEVILLYMGMPQNKKIHYYHQVKSSLHISNMSKVLLWYLLQFIKLLYKI